MTSKNFIIEKLYPFSSGTRLNTPFQKGYYFDKNFFQKEMFLLDFCYEILNLAESNAGYKNSAEYYFALSMVSWENKEYEKHRESFFILIFYFYNRIPPIVFDVSCNTNNLYFSERLNFLDNSFEDYNEIDCAHHYFKILFLFINFGVKKKIGPYINGFKKIYDLIKSKNVNITKLSYHDEILLYFYEYFHSFVKENNAELLKLTSFIQDNIVYKESQTLLFFLSFNQLNKDDIKAIKYANDFLLAENFAANYSYTKSLYLNTLRATIRQSQWQDYSHFLILLKGYLGDKHTEYLDIQKKGEEKYEKEQKRISHPLNPQNIIAIQLEDVPSEILIYLTALINSCGEDWGIFLNEKKIKYTFPSIYLTEKILILLLVNNYLKISNQDFNKIEEDELYNFYNFINNNRLHLNIEGVIDTKIISSQILKDEMIRRSDINDAIVNVWKEIVIGYFYSSFEYYLDKVSDQWAEDFVLNEDTKNKIEKISTSAKRLSFTASSAIRSTIAFHELDSTSVKHTQNVLLHNINKYLKFIEENSADYSKTRYEKAPILSIERLIDDMFNISPDTLYNEIPSYKFIGI